MRVGQDSFVIWLGINRGKDAETKEKETEQN